MSATNRKNPRKTTSFILPPLTRATLKKIKARHGVTNTAAISRGVALLEKTLEGVV